MKAIFTKYHGPTNVKGSRVSASDSDGNRVTLSWDCALNTDQNHRRAAVALCHKMKWAGKLAEGDTRTGMVFVWIDQPGAATLETDGAGAGGGKSGGEPTT